jgi:signal transduction histidine kinase
VQKVRADRGGIALGVVAPDEAGALLALEAGADESVAFDRLDAASALGFLERVRTRARLRGEQARTRALHLHQEKLGSLGTLVAGMAHEVNNPLTALLLTVEALKHRVSSAPLPAAQTLELLDEIEVSARTIAAVVRDLKVFSRPDGDEAAPEVVKLEQLIEQVLRVVGRQVRSLAALELDYEPDVPEVVVPAARLAQVFTNILVNAAHAVSQVERPEHVVRIGLRSDAGAVVVEISDTGPGIPESAIERIFEPFFTTKERGVGTGIGLSISRSIVRRFGGDLVVESVQGDGATFSVVIPRPSERELAEAREHARSLLVPSSSDSVARSVLIVEPDPRVLRALGHALESEFDVVGFEATEEAIEYLECGYPVDAIVADVSPPEAPAVELYEFLLQRRPELSSKLLLMMGEEQDLPEELARSGLPLLGKPISQSRLVRALHARLG